MRKIAKKRAIDGLRCHPVQWTKEMEELLKAENEGIIISYEKLLVSTVYD